MNNLKEYCKNEILKLRCKLDEYVARENRIFKEYKKALEGVDAIKAMELTAKFRSEINVIQRNKRSINKEIRNLGRKTR